MQRGKFLAGLLSLSVVFSAVPVDVHAEEGIDAGVNLKADEGEGDSIGEGTPEGEGAGEGEEEGTPEGESTPEGEGAGEGEEEGTPAGEETPEGKSTEERKSARGGDPEEENEEVSYDISVREGIIGGSITFEKDADGIVTVYPVEEEGYTLTSIGYCTVNENGKKGSLVTVAADENGKYTFEMPESDILVGAAFQDDFQVIQNKIGGTSATDYLVHVLLGDAFLYESSEKTSARVIVDERFFETGKEDLYLRAELRMWNDDGYKVVGSAEYSLDEVQEMNLTTDNDEDGMIVIDDFEIAIQEDIDLTEGHRVYAVIQFARPCWVNAIGTPQYRWAYTEDATVLRNDAKMPQPIVWLYNLNENGARGSLVRKILRDLDIPVGTVTNENLNQNIGYLVGWEGYEPVEDAYSSEFYDVEYMLIGNLSDIQLEDLMDAMMKNNIRVNLKSVPTAWTASKTFAELFDIMAEESETFQAIFALDGLIYDAEELTEEKYGSSQHWDAFQKALEQANAAMQLEEDELEDKGGAEYLYEIYDTLLEQYLLVTEKTLLEGELELILEENEDGSYDISARINGAEDSTFSYAWMYTSTTTGTVLENVPADDLYKVKLEVNGTGKYYGELTASLKVPADPIFTLSAEETAVSVALEEIPAAVNMPEPKGYVAQIYQNGTLIEKKETAEAGTLTFDGLTKETEYTVEVYAYNEVGRGNILTETITTGLSEEAAFTIIVDGKKVGFAEEITFDEIDLNDTKIFANGAADAYQVTINGETKLVGDTTLKNWVGNWETWQDYIYPDADLMARYPYLERAWELAYPAYVGAFEGTFMEDMIKAQYPDVNALKKYWYDMTYTNGVSKIIVEAKEGGYLLSWKDAEGKTLESSSYTMTGKILNGLEGATMYVFTADKEDISSGYKYLVTMAPDMEGEEETPIAKHYHFQFGSDLDAILAHGQLNNGITYNETTGKKESDMVDKYWYATMTDADATDIAKYNVILGMHLAEKWSQLPEVTGITISPQSTSVRRGNTLRLKADVAGTAGVYTDVTWTLEGNASEGTTISEDGLLTVASGESAGTVLKITATSVENPAFSATAEVTVANKSSSSSSSSSSSGSSSSKPDADEKAEEKETVEDTMEEAEEAEKNESAVSSDALERFDDVKASDWFAPAVSYVYDAGIMGGVEVDAFGAHLTTTRAMIWTILARMDGVDTSKGDTWYTAGREWAMENGISDGTAPMDSITREQLAAMLYRFARYQGENVTGTSANLNSFKDAEKISDYAVQAMNWAVGERIMNGNDDGTLNPGGNATRAHAAQMLMNFMER